MTCTCYAQYMSGTGGGKPGEWGREGYRWQKKKDWEVGFLKGWKAGEICINKNNATIMLNLLQSKKGYREEANQKERQKVGKQSIYLFIYLSAFLDTGLPRGNVNEWDSGLMRGAIPTQSHQSNHLQMSLQRQYFLLSFLKTLSVGLAIF